jgi:hypothetical protein
MKLLAFVILMCLSTFSNAKELTVISSYISCLGKKEMGLFKYKAALIIKNTGKENLVLITKIDGIGVVNDNQVFFLDAGAVLFEETKIIPPESDLGLVETYPGEGVEVKGFLFSSKPLKDEIIVSYEIRDSYDGRYKNWQGIVKSKPISVSNSNICIL